MVQKTIAVNITGESEIDRVSKKISHLRNAVLKLEEEMKAGLSNNPAISLKIKLDAKQFKKDFTALKKELEGNSVSVKSNSSKSTNSNKNTSKNIVSNVNNLTDDIKKASEKAGVVMQKGISESSKGIAKGIAKGATEFNKQMEAEAKKILASDSSDYGKLRANKLRFLALAKGISEGTVTKTRGLTAKDLGFSTNSSGRAVGIPETATGKVSFSRDNIVSGLRDLVRLEGISNEIKREAQRQIDIFNNPNFKSPEIRGFTDFLNALEQVKGGLDTVNQKLLNFISTSASLAGLNPFKSFLGGATALTRSIVNLNTQLGRTVGGAIVGTLRNSFNSLRAYGTQAIRSLASETQELGDAMVSYRNNMRAMDMDEDSINRNLKEMGDYGKASVYNAGDLLEMLSTYKAYGLSDDESKNLTKAMAGLVSNRSDSNEALGRASKQLNDIFVRGNASTQDLRIMRSWFNPLASAKIQASLEEIAKGKGYSNLQEAIEDRAISAEDTKKAIIELGLTNKTFKDSNGELVNEFQAMVNNIATPRQAIDNLKETLANLFAYDKVSVNEDGTTNVEPGALGALYNRTAQLIKGIADIAGSATFERGVTALGNDLAKTIDSVIDFGSKWNTQFSAPFLSSLKNFYRNLKEGVDVNGIGDYANNLTRNVIEFNNLYGKKIGEAIGNAVKNGTELLSLLSELGKQFVGADGLKILDELGKFFNNLANVAIDTNAVQALVETYKLFYEGANEVVSNAQNIQGAKGVVESYRNFLYALKDMIVFIGSQTNIVPNALEVISSFIDMVTGVVTKVRGSVSVREVNQFSNNIKDFFTETMGALEDIYAQIISSAIKAGSSNAGKQFFESVKDFIVSVNEAILSALQALGGGNAQAGIEKLMSYATIILDSLATIVKTMGEHPLLTGGILVATKFGSVAISVIQILASVIENMKILSGTSLGGGLLGKLFGGGGASGGVGVDGTGLVGGLFNKSWRNKGSQAIKKGWTKFADFAGSAFVGKPEIYIGSKNLGTPSPDKKGLSVPITSVLGYNRTNPFTGKSFSFNPFKNVSAAGVKQFSNRLISGMASAKGQLIAMGITMGTEMADSFVQNSKAPQWFKNTSNFVRGGANIAGTTASWAGLGSAFGPVGTVVGGGIGLTASIIGEINRSNAKKEEQKAIKAEAKRIANERIQVQMDLVQQEFDTLADNSRFIRDEYVKSIKDSSEASLSTVRNYLEQTAYDRNTDLAGVLKQLGLNTTEIPEGIENMFVNLNGQLVNFKDLQEKTGLDTGSLVGVLNELSARSGQPVLQLLDEYGNVIQTIQQYTSKEQGRQAERVEKFKKLLEEDGNSASLFEELTYSQLETLKTDMQTALSTTYEKKEDKKQALIEAIQKNTGQNTEFLQNYTLKQLEDFAKSVQEATQEATQTPEERKAELSAELQKRLKNNKDLWEKKNKELMNATVEEYEEAINQLDSVDEAKNYIGSDKEKEDTKLLTEMQGKINQLKTAYARVAESVTANYNKQVSQAIDNLRNSEEGSEQQGTSEELIRNTLADIGVKSKELQDKIIEKVKINTNMTLESAIKAVQEEEQPNYEELFQEVTAKRDEFKKAIQEAMDNGLIPLEEGKNLLAMIDFSTIDPNTIGLAGNALHLETGNTVNKSKNKLNEGAGKAKKDFSDIDTGGIWAAAQGLWDAVSSTIANALQALNDAMPGTPKKSKQAPAKKGSVPQATGYVWTGGLISLSRATGGIIPAYHSQGLSVLPNIDWKPRATDTVPTMLTPGEFVLRKKAVDSIGLGLLRKMNTQGIKALQNTSSSTIINNIYNNNNAQVTQNVDNKSSYLNSMEGLDRIMRYV